MTVEPPARSAWLAGATGLVGAALWPLLLRSGAYRSVQLLARRPLPATAGEPKLQVHVVDFARLPADLPAPDDVYIALGTTIKAAGSQAAFRRVDFDHVVDTARAARAAGAQRLAVVSSLGANAGSRAFYNRVKGEMQAAIGQLGYDVVTIAQPSLLLGDRAALGQAERPGERWVMRFAGPVMGLLPKAVRPIEAGAVAAALLQATLAAAPGVRILTSSQMQARRAA